MSVRISGNGGTATNRRIGRGEVPLRPSLPLPPPVVRTFVWKHFIDETNKGTLQQQQMRRPTLRLSCVSDHLYQPRHLRKTEFLRFERPHNATFSISRQEISYPNIGGLGHHRSMTMERSARSFCSYRRLIPEKKKHFTWKIGACNTKVITCKPTGLVLGLAFYPHAMISRYLRT